MKKEPEYDNGFYIFGWIAIAFLLGLIILCLVTGKDLTHFVSDCPFRKLTGFYCPGCGGTHAAVYLARGQIIKSFLSHPVVLYTAIIGAIYMITQTIWRISGKRMKFVMHFRMLYVYLLLAIVAINWIAKNAILLLA